MASVLADAVTRRVSDPDPVNLAFGTRTDLLTVISMIESILGHRIERHHIDSRPGDVRHSQADGTRLLELFPAVGPVALEDGLRKRIDWMRKFHR